jgi:hypothetical protein
VLCRDCTAGEENLPGQRALPGCNMGFILPTLSGLG